MIFSTLPWAFGSMSTRMFASRSPSGYVGGRLLVAHDSLFLVEQLRDGFELCHLETKLRLPTVRARWIDGLVNETDGGPHSG